MPATRPSIFSKSIVGCALIVFLIYGEFCSKNQKPAGFCAGGLWGFFDLSGRLVQAMAVRRHGCPMMVVMTVMAAAIHLFQK
jgi:hypothetical protein